MFRKLALFLVAVAVSCAQADADTAKDSLTIGVKVEPVTLYPYGSNDNATARATVNIFDRLIEKNENGELVPSLATSWTFIDPTTLRLTLRTNVVFHNGEQFTADDVKYSIERMLESPDIEHIANPMSGVEIIDPYTVDIKLHSPFAAILSHLAHSAMAMLNVEAAEEAGENIDQVPVGTGPYVLKEWNRGQNLVLEAFPDYWGEQPQVKVVDMRVIPDDSARAISLQTGDVDIVYDVAAVDRGEIMNNADLTLIERPIARIEYLGLNIQKRPEFANVQFRQAIAYAIDTEGIISSVLFGAATPADSIIYESVVGHYDGLTPRRRDLDRARELLAESGVDVASMAPIQFWTSEGNRQRMLEIIQANLTELGIRSEINVYEWGRFLNGTGKGEHDAFMLGWTTVTGDADYGIYNLVHSSAAGGSGNRTFYSNPEVDALLDQGRAEIDPERRNEIYARVQQIVFDEVAINTLFYPTSNVATSSKIKAFAFDPADAHKFINITLQ